jgi:hypothetical protein
MTIVLQNPPFTCIVDRTFGRRLWPVTGLPIVEDACSVIGLSRRSWVGADMPAHCCRPAVGFSGISASGSKWRGDNYHRRRFPASAGLFVFV